MSLLGIVVCTFSVVSATAALAQPDLERTVAGVAANPGIPGIAAAVVSSESTLGVGVAGVRAVDDQSAALVVADDPWHLGSNTKVLTALVAARLVDRAVLSWDSTVGEVLSDHLERAGEPAQAYADVTLRQLLDHTSGVPDNAAFDRAAWGSFFAMDAASAEDRARAVEAILASPPLSKPGDSFRYSNLGYMVAGAMLEASAGSPWESLMQSELAEPLGLTTLGFGVPGDLDTTPPDTPRGHSGAGKNLRTIDSSSPVTDNPRVMGPAGTAHLGFEDYQALARILLQGARSALQESVAPPNDSSGARWVSREAWREVLGDAALTGSAPGYGLGIGFAPGAEGQSAGASLSHSGSNTMWFTTITLYPSIDRAGIVCINAAGPAAQQVSQTLANRLPPLYSEATSEGD